MEQTRMNRRYRVTLTDGGTVTSFSVNLTYDVDADFNAVEDGKVVPADSVQAQFAAVQRLRRLSDKGKVAVSRAEIDRADWSVELRAWKLVPV